MQQEDASKGDIITYEDFYKKAMTTLNYNLREKVLNEKERKKVRFLSLGRKGAKIYECLSKYATPKEEKEEDLKTNKNNGDVTIDDIDVISEHALPFISRKDNEGGGIVYCLLDDGLYYGSSAIGTAKAVYGFQKIFGKFTPTTEKIGYFGAIDTDELRLNFDRYIGETKALNTRKAGFANGYSHFFVKRLASDIRSFENTFEIEFPIVTFSLDKRPEKMQGKRMAQCWEDAAKEAFQGMGVKVYIVKHAENFSVNILLPNTGGSSFKKIRIFPNDPEKNNGRANYAKVVCMAPHPIADGEMTLIQLFDDAGDEYKQLWEEIVGKCYVESPLINADNVVSYINTVRPRCNRSLVIMANYLLSYSTIIEQLDKLKELFKQLGLHANFEGIDYERDLYYLLGDKDFCKKVRDKLSDFYHTRTTCGSIYTSQRLRVNYPAFENSKNVEENTPYLFGLQNNFMMKTSQNMEEALGALLFNQDVFFEKQILASNPITQDYNRLRLGYTYEWLYDTIQEALDKDYFSLAADEDPVITLHRWVDQRIGEAGIVPQYILDEKSKYWVRVFRHGENEDTLLSHLARFVLLVYSEQNKKIHLGWILRDKFEKLLTTAYKAIDPTVDSEKVDPFEDRRKSQIVESVNIGLFEDSDGKLKYLNNHYHKNEQAGAARDVLQYMIDMCILSDDEISDGDERDKITIHPRTKFFLKNDIFGITTLGSEAEAAVRNAIANYENPAELNITTS